MYKNKVKKIKELETEIAKLKSSVAELKVLNEIAVSSGKATDTYQILNLIVQKTIRTIQAEQGSILLITKTKDKPFITFIRRENSSGLKRSYHIGTDITGWVLNNKKPLIIENLSEDKRFKPSEEEKKDIRSVLCVPIWFKGEIIGLMILINKKNQMCFSKEDLTLFSIISVQTGQLIKNLELQKQTFQERKEWEKLYEMDRIKTNFFMNISHEFKTPLSLIMNPAKQIIEISEDEKIKRNAEIIFKNTSKLNNLINQILESAKIEAGYVKLKASPINLMEIIRETVSMFKSAAEIKNISLKVILQKEKLIVYLDKDKIYKVISNLLSNAIKFTSDKGSINIEVRSVLNPQIKKVEEKSRFAEISISDTGIGIANEHLDKIFDRFYTVETEYSKVYNGTGIGLSLCKELVELHKGKIFVQSEQGVGTKFKILLPLGKEHLLPEEINKKTSSENKYEDDSILFKENLIPFSQTEVNYIENNENTPLVNLEKNIDKPLLLIIDDNYDLRKYIAKILRNYYNTIEASDGRQGLELSFKTIPELIITDIIMPGMDGIELCSILKSDTRTSHIPIILLTAKADINNKVEGFDSGADDYISKPFEAVELKARIKSLMEQRKRVHKHIQKFGFLIDDVKINSVDQEFLQQAIAVINKNLSDSNFHVEKLAENLAVSRSLLHKKLVTLVGESPSELIKRIRLNKAAKLIEKNSGNISEIAFETGFNNPSYFARCFLKQFGFKPSEYHRHN